jgi:hypothetical protein
MCLFGGAWCVGWQTYNIKATGANVFILSRITGWGKKLN